MFMWKEKLLTAFADFSPRERDILVRRFALDFDKSKCKKVQWRGRELILREETLASVGKSFGITRERVRQLEAGIEKKTKDIISGQKEAFAVLAKSAEDILDELGGACEENMFFYKLIGLDPARFSEWTPAQFSERQAAFFILSQCFTGSFERVLGSAHFYPIWKKQKFAWADFQNTLLGIEKMLQEQGEPVKDEELRGKIRATLPSGVAVKDEILNAWLTIMKKVQKNALGLWGLTNWTSIVPKRIGDKIDLIFQREERPLHFRDLTKLINALGIDHKIASEGSVRNELIAATKYVLVGRGLYALASWGYKPGKVKEVIARILKQQDRPMAKEEILSFVLKERFIKETTVHAVLSNRAWFEKLPGGEYTAK